LTRSVGTPTASAAASSEHEHYQEERNAQFVHRAGRTDFVAEQAGTIDTVDTVRAARNPQIGGNDARDLAEPKRDDREVVAAQAQSGVADDDAGNTGKREAERQRFPEREVQQCFQQRRRVRTDGEEGRIAQIQQPRISDNNIQPEPEDRIGGDRQADVDDIAAGDRRQRHGGEQKSAACRRAAPTR
jgi:hypothetical protein